VDWMHERSNALISTAVSAAALLTLTRALAPTYRLSRLQERKKVTVEFREAPRRVLGSEGFTPFSRI
jgi:hypothetical protein